MVNQIAYRPEMIYATNELHRSTEETLKKVVEKKDWTLEGLENWKLKSIQLTIVTIGGVLAGYWAQFTSSTPVPFYSVAMMVASSAAGCALISNSGALRSTRFEHLSNLVAIYKKDADPSNNKVIAEKLEKIIKKANTYITSRNYSEYCLGATLLVENALGAWSVSSESNYLPETLRTAALMMGLAGTATFALCHHIYKSQDLQKISQKVNECLKILEQQKPTEA
jgi:hypothetical protein